MFPHRGEQSNPLHQAHSHHLLQTEVGDFKGTVGVISSEPPFTECYAQSKMLLGFSTLVYFTWAQLGVNSIAKS